MATRSAGSSSAPAARQVVGIPLLLAALCFAGANLRTVLLEVPPILPLIQRDLGLSYTATGLLNALPPLLLGLGAYPASVAIGRLGSRRAIALSLGVITVTSLLRALCPNALSLYSVTILLSLGIALGQTAVPLVVQEWFPGFIGQATAAYSTGLMIGEIAAASFTSPWLLHWVAGGQWRATFLIWSAPVLLSLALWLIVAPRQSEGHATSGKAARRATMSGVIRDPRVWQAGFLLSGSSLLFFGMDTWIPVYFAHLHRTDGTLALAVLATAQLPPSFALMAWGRHFAGRPSALVVAGLVAVGAMGAWFIAPASWDVALSGVIGAASAAIFILALSLPSLIRQGSHVAEISAVVLGTSYTLAFFGPFLGGALWDGTHVALTAFVPVGLAAVLVAVLGAFMPDYRQRA